MVVDDETVIADTVSAILSSVGYLVSTEYSAEDALETALISPPDLLLSDVLLPRMNGIDLAIRVSSICPDCKVILFSGHAATSDLMATARADGHHFELLVKPIPPRDLIAHVAQAFRPVN